MDRTQWRQPGPLWILKDHTWTRWRIFDTREAAEAYMLATNPPPSGFNKQAWARFLVENLWQLEEAEFNA